MRNVIFDFDGTLTSRDTLRPLAHYLAASGSGHAWQLFLLYCCVLAARLRLISDRSMKELFLKLFLRGKTPRTVGLLVDGFINAKLPALLSPEIFDSMRRHIERGDRIFIVSANFDFLIGPLGRVWGAFGTICTQTEVVDGVFTGRIVGETCKGRNKVERLRETLSSFEISGMVAYGNADDGELLALAGESVLI